MAAVMTAESGDVVKIYEAVEECKKMGINVLPPDVNESLNNFTVIDQNNIRFGLNAIKNLGYDVITQIKEQRNIGGKFKYLKDFLLRIDKKNFNKKSWEALVKSGALDAFGERNQMLFNTENILEFVRDHAKIKQSGQESLFGATPVDDSDIRLTETTAATDDEKLLWEKELLGLYVSSHPLNNYKNVLSQIMKVGALTDEMIDSNVSVGGIISKLKKSLTKKQEPMVFLNLEDQSGSIEALIFPKTLQRFGNLIELEQIVQITGRLSEKDGEFKLIAEEVRELQNDDLYQMNVQDIENNSVIEIYLPEKVSRQTMDSMKAILTRFPGNTTVNLLITDELGTPQKTINTKLKVSFSEQMLKELRALKEITRVLVKNGR